MPKPRVKTQSLSSNVRGKEGLPTPDLGSLPPPPGAGECLFFLRAPQPLQPWGPLVLLSSPEVGLSEAGGLAPVHANHTHPLLPLSLCHTVPSS